jgi:hypothetical protein
MRCFLLKTLCTSYGRSRTLITQPEYVPTFGEWNRCPGSN